jgi:hypothetical protein
VEVKFELHDSATEVWVALEPKFRTDTARDVNDYEVREFQIGHKAFVNTFDPFDTINLACEEDEFMALDFISPSVVVMMTMNDDEARRMVNTLRHAADRVAKALEERTARPASPDDLSALDLNALKAFAQNPMSVKEMYGSSPEVGRHRSRPCYLNSTRRTRRRDESQRHPNTQRDENLPSQGRVRHTRTSRGLRLIYGGIPRPRTDARIRMQSVRRVAPRESACSVSGRIRECDLTSSEQEHLESLWRDSVSYDTFPKWLKKEEAQNEYFAMQRKPDDADMALWLEFEHSATFLTFSRWLESRKADGGTVEAEAEDSDAADEDDAEAAPAVGRLPAVNRELSASTIARLDRQSECGEWDYEINFILDLYETVWANVTSGGVVFLKGKDGSTAKLTLTEEGSDRESRQRCEECLKPRTWHFCLGESANRGVHECVDSHNCCGRFAWEDADGNYFLNPQDKAGTRIGRLPLESWQSEQPEKRPRRDRR